MTSSILTNQSAMIALQNLRNTNSQLSDINSQISTGKKVATAKDNAAVFAISQVMESDVAGFQSITESLSLGSSTLAVASNATNEISSLLNEIKGKVVAAQEENVDRATLQNEIEQLVGQIDGITESAQFNGLNLLNTEEEISVLSSLNRSSSGAVSSDSIGFTGRNFTADAGAVGTGASGKNASISGTGVTAGTSTIEFTSSAGFVTDAGGAADFYRLEVDNITIDVSAADIQAEGIVAAGADATDEDVAEFLARAINGTLTADPSKNLGIQGVTATVGANAGTPANAELTISSTSSEDISIADDDTSAAGATGAPSSASLAAVVGETNTRASVGLDLVDANAAAAGETFAITVGDNTFTFTNDATNPATTAAAATEIVDALNADAEAQGIDDVLFEVDGTTNTQINVVNLNSEEGFDISFSTTFGTNAGNVNQLAPAVNAADAGAVNIDVSGNVLEGDSFTVEIGTTTATYVAGKNEDVNDVIRGLQNVIAADGPSDVITTLNFAADPDSDVASISIESVEGKTVGLSEARGGTESTGDLYGLSRLDVTTAEGAERALNTIENLIQTNIGAQADFGASERRIEIQSDFMSSLIDSFKSGIGALVDADLEEASARLQALQVQQQLGVQALSIANQAPQNILALFR
ncbi:MAG: flagellin [Pseudomonadota bacterium]